MNFYSRYQHRGKNTIQVNFLKGVTRKFCFTQRRKEKQGAKRQYNLCVLFFFAPLRETQL